MLKAVIHKIYRFFVSKHLERKKSTSKTKFSFHRFDNALKDLLDNFSKTNHRRRNQVFRSKYFVELENKNKRSKKTLKC